MDRRMYLVLVGLSWSLLRGNQGRLPRQAASGYDLKRCGTWSVEKQETAGLSRTLASPEGLGEWGVGGVSWGLL